MMQEPYGGFSSPLSDVESAVFGALMLRPGSYFSGRDLVGIVSGLDGDVGERVAQVGVSGILRRIAAKVDTGADDFPRISMVPGHYAASYSPVLPPIAYSPSETIPFGDGYALHSAAKKVTKAGQDVHFSPQEYNLLEALVLNQGVVLSNSQLLSAVGHSDPTAPRDLTKVVVRRIRMKVDPDGRFIHSRRGFGYVLESQ